MAAAPGKKRSVAQAQQLLASSCGFMRPAAPLAACRGSWRGVERSAVLTDVKNCHKVTTPSAGMAEMWMARNRSTPYNARQLHARTHPG